MRRLLDASGETIKVFHGDDTDTFYIQERQDATDIARGNWEARKADTTYSKSRDLRLKARIDVATYNKWLNEGMPAYDKHERVKWINKKLREPEYQYLKTADGPDRFRVYGSGR